MVQLKGQYQLSDFQDAQALHARTDRPSAWLVAVVVGAVVGSTVLEIVLAILVHFPWPLLILPIMFLAFWALNQWVLWPRRIARVFHQQKDLSAPFEIELSDEGFHVQNKFGSARIPWQDFAKWQADDNVIILYRSDAIFHLLPRRLFRNDGEVEYMLGRLRAHNVPLAKTVTKRLQITVVAGLAMVAIILLIARLSVR